MERVYNQNKARFINLYGNAMFDKLYYKVSESRAIVKLTGITVNSGLPPTAKDFLASANMIPYVVLKLDISVSVMAALIELKKWNETVNNYRQLISEQHLNNIADQIAARWF